jgi:hypothetical protein
MKPAASMTGKQGSQQSVRALAPFRPQTACPPPPLPPSYLACCEEAYHINDRHIGLRTLLVHLPRFINTPPPTPPHPTPLSYSACCGEACQVPTGTLASLHCQCTCSCTCPFASQASSPHSRAPPAAVSLACCEEACHVKDMHIGLLTLPLPCPKWFRHPPPSHAPPPPCPAAVAPHLL